MAAPLAVAVASLTLAALLLAFSPTAEAQSASDPRATFHTGNVTTCAEAGFPGTIQMGRPDDSTGSDPNVVGVVTTNAGTVRPGQGQELRIALLDLDVVVHGVVVKGGAAYNVYSAPAVLPPALLSPQHYISPFNGGGNVPGISHWFVCYTLVTPPPIGDLTVFKTVQAPSGDGLPVTPPPNVYRAAVSCTGHAARMVSFESGGGEGIQQLTGLAVGTVCTVVENTPGLPAGTVVTYTPAGANTTGVAITSSATAEVTIVNDFSNLPVQTGTLQLEKVLNNPDGLAVPADYTAHVVCNDGVTNADVTLPGHGGSGTPVLHPRVNFDCTIQEVSVPAGWTVHYSVNGGPSTTTPPDVFITSSTEIVTVTITNDPAATTTTTTTVATTGTTTVATTGTTTAAAETASSEPSGSGSGNTLAATGSSAWDATMAGLVALFVGSLLVAGSRWRKRSH